MTRPYHSFKGEKKPLFTLRPQSIPQSRCTSCLRIQLSLFFAIISEFEAKGKFTTFALTAGGAKSHYLSHSKHGHGSSLHIPSRQRTVLVLSPEFRKFNLWQNRPLHIRTAFSQISLHRTQHLRKPWLQTCKGQKHCFLGLIDHYCYCKNLLSTLILHLTVGGNGTGLGE